VTVPVKARIVLADDHPVVRRGLRLILDGEPDLQVVAEAADGAEALELALAEDVNLAVFDVAMPRLTGLQAARELARRRPGLRVLILSMHENEQYVLEAARAGAAGYVSKSVADRELVEACRAALRGEPFICPPATRPVVARVLEQGHDRAADPLTPRESEILKLVAEGHNTKEIAEALVISEKTVEKHRRNLLEKLQVRDRVDLTRYAIRTGLTEP
jgi:DNA-binding NarL/FixJ family response regulator